MSTTKRPKSKKKPPPPPSEYPATPHIIGMDWIELPVHRPVTSASLYCSIGFAPRGSVGQSRAVAIGGTVIVFKRNSKPHDGPAPRPTGALLQLPVDNVEMKRQQMIDMGLKPGPFRRQPRGDRAFEWRDPDGHTVRFVGPARQASDKTLID